MKRLIIVTTVLIVAISSTMAYPYELQRQCESFGVCHNQYWDHAAGENPMPLWINPDGLNTQVIASAADEWATTGNANFSFEIAGETEITAVEYDGVNLVTARTDSVMVPLGDGVYVDGCDEANLAFSFTASVDSEGEDLGKILEKDVAFCQGKHDYYVGTDAPAFYEYDLWSLATHELGHNLGLADVYEDEDATMQIVTEPGDIKKRTLSPDDVAGIQEIYGAIDNDKDDDGIDNDTDNCVDKYNPEQEDTDHDGKGDVCDLFNNIVSRRAPQKIDRSSNINFTPTVFKIDCLNGPAAFCIKIVVQ